MNDIDQTFGQDIGVGPTGDLLPVDASVRTKQRLLRRLITAPETYLWHPGYGAGVPADVGAAMSPDRLREIKAAITGQVLQEEAVAQSPAPVVTLKPSGDDLYCSIQFTEAANNTPQVLTFTVSP